MFTRKQHRLHLAAMNRQHLPGIIGGGNESTPRSCLYLEGRRREACGPRHLRVRLGEEGTARPAPPDSGALGRVRSGPEKMMPARRETEPGIVSTKGGDQLRPAPQTEGEIRSMRILVWKCRRWMGRKVYSESWWQEHSDLHHIVELAGESRYMAPLAMPPVLPTHSSFPSPRSLVSLGFASDLPAVSRG